MARTYFAWNEIYHNAFSRSITNVYAWLPRMVPHLKYFKENLLLLHILASHPPPPPITTIIKPVFAPAPIGRIYGISFIFRPSPLQFSWSNLRKDTNEFVQLQGMFYQSKNVCPIFFFSWIPFKVFLSLHRYLFIISISNELESLFIDLILLVCPFRGLKTIIQL